MKVLQGLLVYIAFAVIMSTAANASIVNDPVALKAKLAELQEERMARHEAREQYWADYRALPEVQVKRERCSKVYSTKGNYRKCRWETVTEKDTSNFNQKMPSIAVTGEGYNG